MPLFEYRAVDLNHKTVKGVIQADSARQARDDLRNRQLTIQWFQERIKASSSASVTQGIRYLFLSKRITTFLRELSTLLAVGIPLVDAIDILIEQAQGRFSKVLLEIRESILGGTSLSVAFQGFPTLFDSFCMSMTEVGESAGTLESALGQLANFREQRDQMKDRLLSSLMYPIVVGCIAVAVTIFLMTSVVPSLLENLEEMGRPLPTPTKILKFVSDLLLDYGLWLVGMFVVTVFIAVAWIQTSRGRKTTFAVLLKAPLLGSLARKQNCSRISLFVGTLTRSGLDPLRAFEITAFSLGNPLYRDALIGTAERVRRGLDFDSAFAPYAFLFPPTVVRLFSLGQNSGQLDSILLRLSDDLDRETATIANRLATLIEPILIVSLGMVVGFILLATMLPILEAGNMN